MPDQFSDADLEAYLDEGLLPAEMARIETAARGDEALLRRLSAINARRDHGSHTLGEIWRYHRLSCPTRAELGSSLLGVLSTEEEEYIKFHLNVIGCRYCQANWNDLANQQAEAAEAKDSRRRKYFQTSAGYLRK
ncbi:MAG TPA: hypothetical protein VHD36_15950 [Pirellulales bacterium]|nr:hypothetical protein [Pirellulales bacterium]